jgi:hypothetical protein
MKLVLNATKFEPLQDVALFRHVKEHAQYINKQ